VPRWCSRISGSSTPTSGTGAEFSRSPGESYRALFHQAQTRLAKSPTTSWAPPFELGDAHVVPEEDLAETNRQLGELWTECSASEERAHGTLEKGAPSRSSRPRWENFASLRIDLGMLQGDQSLSRRCCVGTIQSDHLPP